ADLVLEIPTCYCLSPAEKYAFGALSVLDNTNIVNTLAFGSESGNLEVLQKFAYEVYENSKVIKILKSNLEKGEGYAVSFDNAVEKVYGEKYSAVLKNPNDVLGIEYLRAIKKLDSSISPFAIKRSKVLHNDEKTDDNIASGSKIREMILNGEDFYRFIPEIEGDIFKNTATLQNGERVLLHILRNMKREEYLSLADINEGLEQRILNSAKVSKKLDEFFENVKAKRYTLSRIRRIILNAVLQIHDYENSPYIRVLGFSENALPLLKEMKRAAKLPIVSSFADAKKQGKRAEEYFLKEASYTDFYTMLGREIRVSGLEFQKSVVKI
ncbi:MAG: nucleotidyltransferase family protein, partial [Clostridia bacterium]|nr:nucleotidyltransferase family protein [Clostridia bacterium]